ncbi:unnamed protein product, partial [Didymodactylos carnosus]
EKDLSATQNPKLRHMFGTKSIHKSPEEKFGFLCLQKLDLTMSNEEEAEEPRLAVYSAVRRQFH